MPEPERRLFWLSFADSTRPKDQQFLGVAVVEVTSTQAARAKQTVERHFPHAQAGAEWMAAASAKAKRCGCNPGGEVSFIALDPERFPPPEVVPRDQLLTRADLKRLELL